MADSEFKIVAGSTDWGSPMSEMPIFGSLEEAAAAARQFIAAQKREGGPSALGAVVIEETRADGTVVAHAVA
jgi:hypothetical protein